jgi:hypothetical protein
MLLNIEPGKKMSDIVKTKFLCKTGSRTAPRGPLENIKWKDRFIEDKWYDGEYETWSWEDGRINSGWRRYWVINELGEKEEISKSMFKVLFETDTQQLRDRKIEDLIK